MASVHTFWWLREDELAFIEYLESFGRIVAYALPWKSSPNEVVGVPLREALLKDDLGGMMLALGLRPDLVPIDCHDFPGSGKKYNIVPSRSCVLHYSRGRLVGGKLTRSNLSAYWQTLADGAQPLIPKDVGFVSFGKAVFLWARKRTPHEKGFYRMSSAAKNAERDGHLALVDY